MEIGPTYKSGSLTVVSRATGKRSTYKSWLCECVCGNTIVLRQSILLKKKRISCAKKECRARFIDYTGKKFGLLTAVSRIGYEKSSSGQLVSRWLFQCDCTKKVERIITRVLSYKDRSNCGCVSTTRRSKTHTLPNNDGIKNKAYGQHLRAARSRNLVSYLTKEEYIAIAEKPCHYCGDMSYRKGLAGKIRIPFNSVDRENNEDFYSLSNSIPACFVCQRMKGNLTKESFFEKLEKIKQHQVALKELK